MHRALEFRVICLSCAALPSVKPAIGMHVLHVIESLNIEREWGWIS